MKYQVISLVDIMRCASGSDCTNGGLSTKHENATLLVPEGMQGAYGPIELLGGLREIDPTQLKGAVFELMRRDLYGIPYFHCEPFGEQRWCMFGGNCLDYSGNGFHSICGYPIRIHDRIEE